MRITESQENILNQLVCQRLSSDEINKELIKSFECTKGKALVDYLRRYAWEEDTDGSIAFYVIKNPDGEILLFFSLKCGALFEPLDEDEIQARIESFNELLDAMHAEDGENDTKKPAMQAIEQLRRSSNFTLDQIRSGIKRQMKNDTQMLHGVNADKAQERNRKIIRVGETYPGVELVHFCSNDNAKKYWNRCGIDHPMGEVLFWWYITPIIFDVQAITGCQYVFLFAADTSADRLLVNYYEVSLKFLSPVDIGTSKPRYDFCCEFMCQKTNDLRKNRESYFEAFNPDAGDEVV